jgi:hypothetical protein
VGRNAAAHRRLMQVVRPGTIVEWIRLATPLLMEHEAEHGILLGVALSTPVPKPDAYWALVMDGERVVAAGLRTADRLILSRQAAPGAMACLAMDAMSPATRAVLGPKAEAAAFISATTDKWTAGLLQRIYELRAVVPPPPAPGSHRLAGPSDRDVLADWVCAFHDEATSDGFQREAVERRNDHHIAAGAFHVWEDRGRLMAVHGCSGPHAQRYPDQHGVHAARAPRAWVWSVARGRGMPTSTRWRAKVRAATCRSRQSHVEPTVYAGRVSPRRRR